MTWVLITGHVEMFITDSVKVRVMKKKWLSEPSKRGDEKRHIDPCFLADRKSGEATSTTQSCAAVFGGKVFGKRGRNFYRSSGSFSRDQSSNSAGTRTGTVKP